MSVRASGKGPRKGGRLLPSFPAREGVRVSVGGRVGGVWGSGLIGDGREAEKGQYVRPEHGDVGGRVGCVRPQAGWGWFWEDGVPREERHAGIE